jgi:multiple sugar transport system substrate-binding protein
MPLNPNHAYCAFLSVGVSLAGHAFWRSGRTLDRAAAIEALEFLRRLAGNLHSASRNDDPIGVSDRMTSTDEVLYVPLMFGYSNYARPGFRPRTLRFGNAPRGSTGAIGSVLGGVGLALSSRSSMRDDAADLARQIGSTGAQTGLYVRAGGQPGHRAAWTSPQANALVGDFFSSTLESMNDAFMRPRVAGHRRFQPLAGALIHECLWSEAMPVSECVVGFERLVETLLPEWRYPASSATIADRREA